MPQKTNWQSWALWGTEFGLLSLLGTGCVPPNHKQTNDSLPPYPSQEQVRSNDIKVWRMSNKYMCIEPAEKPPSPTEQKLQELDDLIRKSRIGQELQNQISKLDFVTCDLEAFGFMLPPNTLGFNSDYHRAVGTRLDLNQDITALQLTTVVHEWRHAWQGATTALSDLSDVRHPFVDTLTKSWMREADADAVSVLFAWDIGQNGNPAVWQDTKQNKTMHGMANAFEAEINKSKDRARPSDQDLARATHAAFEAWFDNDGLKESYYKNIKTNYDKNGPRFELTEADITTVGALPGLKSTPYLSMNDFKRVQEKAQEMHLEQQHKPVQPAQSKPTAPRI